MHFPFTIKELLKSHLQSFNFLNHFDKVHLAIYSILPFILIAIANSLLVYTIHKRKKVVGDLTQITGIQSIDLRRPSVDPRRKSVYKRAQSISQQRNEKMNQTVFLMTLLFIGLTLPIACASFFFDQLFSTDYGVFIITLLDCVSFSYHGLNFIIMAFSNKMFRREFLKILKNEA